LSSFTVVYDANVLYPAPLRDLLLHLARTGLYRARWTEDIHQEWMQSVLANRPDLSRQQLERTRELMNRAVLDCLVTDYQELIPVLTLPDPKDRHVLAAAIRCGADAIVTLNQRDFPADTLKIYGLEALHPDEFVLDLIDLDTPRVLGAVKNQRSLLRNPPSTAQELLKTLKAQGLPRSVALLEQYQELL
jgi:predicted nucleic acid-binding protein